MEPLPLLMNECHLRLLAQHFRRHKLVHTGVFFAFTSLVFLLHRSTRFAIWGFGGKRRLALTLRGKAAGVARDQGISTIYLWWGTPYHL